MLGRAATLAGLMLLAACASVESAGRNARSGEVAAPPASVELAAPPSAPSVELPLVAAPNVAAPAPVRRPQASGEDEVVIPGQVERRAPPPRGDPRSIAQRNEDIRAWDQCVSRAQGVFDTDPMRPQLETPEDVCSASLGMASRDAAPDSRRP
jgi:hypothetical protein